LLQCDQPLAPRSQLLHAVTGVVVPDRSLDRSGPGGNLCAREDAPVGDLTHPSPLACDRTCRWRRQRSPATRRVGLARSPLHVHRVPGLAQHSLISIGRDSAAKHRAGRGHVPLVQPHRCGSRPMTKELVHNGRKSWAMPAPTAGVRRGRSRSRPQAPLGVASCHSPAGGA
jgi:hypothetical protein